MQLLKKLFVLGGRRKEKEAAAAAKLEKKEAAAAAAAAKDAEVAKILVQLERLKTGLSGEIEQLKKNEDIANQEITQLKTLIKHELELKTQIKDDLELVKSKLGFKNQDKEEEEHYEAPEEAAADGTWLANLHDDDKDSVVHKAVKQAAQFVGQDEFGNRAVIVDKPYIGVVYAAFAAQYGTPPETWTIQRNQVPKEATLVFCGGKTCKAKHALGGVHSFYFMEVESGDALPEPEVDNLEDSRGMHIMINYVKDDQVRVHLGTHEIDCNMILISPEIDAVDWAGASLFKLRKGVPKLAVQLTGETFRDGYHYYSDLYSTVGVVAYARERKLRGEDD